MIFGYIEDLQTITGSITNTYINTQKNKSEYIYTNMKSAVTAEILEIEEKAYTEADIWVITKKR